MPPEHPPPTTTSQPLHAIYNSSLPTPHTHEFTYALPPPPPTTPSAATDVRTHAQHKSHYLSCLGKSMVKMQEDINTFLTAKMEEDKMQAAAQGKATGKVEEEAEETYGEEVEGEV